MIKTAVGTSTPPIQSADENRPIDQPACSTAGGVVALDLVGDPRAHRRLLEPVAEDAPGHLAPQRRRRHTGHARQPEQAREHRPFRTPRPKLRLVAHSTRPSTSSGGASTAAGRSARPSSSRRGSPARCRGGAQRGGVVGAVAEGEGRRLRMPRPCPRWSMATTRKWRLSGRYAGTSSDPSWPSTRAAAAGRRARGPSAIRANVRPRPGSSMTWPGGSGGATEAAGGTPPVY